MVTDHFATSLSATDLKIVASVPPGGNWRNIPEDIESRRLDQIRVTAAEGLGSRSTYYGRLQWQKPAYTISTYIGRPGNGCFIHPVANRLITIREAARLQSFPDSYRFSGSARLRQIQVGNAVPPILAYQLGRVLEPGLSLDVFSGGGGLSLGLEWAGFNCIAAIDSNKDAVNTFNTNRTEAIAILADLNETRSYESTIAEIRNRLGNSKLRLLAGGPPCQGFSTAGKNLKEDPRNNLVWVFLKFVEDLSPDLVLMENVPALAWKRGLPTLVELKKRLRREGYHTSMIVAHAEGYGVPQLRRRLFLLAVKDENEAQWPLPTFQISEPSYRKYQPFGTPPLVAAFTVEDAISDLPLASTVALDDEASYGTNPTSLFQSWARGHSSLKDIIPELSVAAMSSQPSFL